MSRRAQKSIFDTPAIVKLIYAYLDSCDGVCLARSSRHLFQTVMPLLWERVEGVSQLLALLPALSDGKEGEAASKAPVDVLTENDFSRFNVYSLWIKHLEVYEDRESPSTGSLPEILCRYSANRTLLPNITTITSTGGAYIPKVLPFLSPSLLRLEFTSANPTQNPTLPMTQSSVLLHVLSEKCPKLRTLAIHPDSEKAKVHPTVKRAKDILDRRAFECVSAENKAKVEDQLQHGLAPFINALPPLVSFSSSDKILDHACFKTISTWPLLESLTITLDPYKGKYMFPELPADTAFPSLKHLALYWIPDRKTFYKFWDVPVLVSKLTSVKLFCSGDLCREKERFTRILLPILSTLAERSPHLQDLWFWAIDSDAMRAYYSTSISTLDVLKKLSLRTLYIEGVHLTDPVVPKADAGDGEKAGKGKSEDKDKDKIKSGGKGKGKVDGGSDDEDDGEGDDDDGEDEDDEDDEDEDEDEEDDDEPGGRCNDVAERLTTMFPGLKELGLPCQELSFADLQTFHSKLPHLEALRFDFSLGSLSELKVDLASVARHRRSRFHTLEANFFGLSEWTKISDISCWGYEDALLFTQYLFSLWPNARIAAQLDPQELEEVPTQEKMIELINEHLALLSYCNQDPSMKYEDVKVLNEESWKACEE